MGRSAPYTFTWVAHVRQVCTMVLSVGCRLGQGKFRNAHACLARDSIYAKLLEHFISIANFKRSCIHVIAILSLSGLFCSDYQYRQSSCHELYKKRENENVIDK